jgi:ABC-type transporter Mla maintaining outer membrane lipid asymmetry ATPase subunit MlaF
MPDAAAPVVQLRDVVKDYRSLRPLRIRHLELRRGESLALLGFDAAMAEVLVNLVTGGTVPDSGEVRVFGRPTASIADRDDWLGMIDRFGLVSERSVLLDQLTVEQNLAIPLSLAVERLSDALRADVRRLADEVRIAESSLAERLGHASPEVRLRTRLGRALALEPEVLLAEHPNATLDREAAGRLAADIVRIAGGRGLATLVMTADAAFARAAARQVFALQPATGDLIPPRSRWRFLSC